MCVTFLALLALHSQVHAAKEDAEDQSWLSKAVRRLLHGETPAPESANSAPAQDVDRRRMFFPDANECADYYHQCAVWAKDGYCQTQPAQMNVRCKASCGLCPKTWSETEGTTKVTRDETTTGTEKVNTKIVDKWGNVIANGPTTGGDGFHTTEGERITEGEQTTELNENKKTESETRFGSQSGTPPARHTFAAVNPLPLNFPAANDCADLDARCAVWAQRGVCVSEPVQMHIYCRASCGLCATGRTDRNWSKTEGITNVKRDEITTGTQKVNSKTVDQWANGGAAGGAGTLIGGAAGGAGTVNGLPWGFGTTQGERITEGEKTTELNENRKTESETRFGGETGTPPAGKFVPAADLGRQPVGTGPGGNWSMTEGTTDMTRDETTTGTENVKTKIADRWAGAQPAGAGQPGIAKGLPWGFGTTQGEKITDSEQTTELNQNQETQSRTEFGAATGTPPAGRFVGGPLFPADWRPTAAAAAGTGNQWSQTTGVEDVTRVEDITGKENVKEMTAQKWANMGAGGLGRLAGTGAGAVNGWLPQGWNTSEGQKLTEAERETIAREQRKMQKTTHFGGETGTMPAGVFVPAAGTGNQWSKTTGVQDVTRDVDITEEKREQEKLAQQWANGGVAAGVGAGLPAPALNGLQWQRGQGEKTTETDRTTVTNEQRNTQATTKFGGTTGTPPAEFARMAAGNAGVFGTQRAVREGDLLGFGAWVSGPDGEAVWLEGEEAAFVLGLN